MNAMERLVNGYFDLKAQTEREQADCIAQIMRLSRQNKDLEKEVARLKRQMKKSNTEIITSFINRFATDKLLTEQQHQTLLSYVREINREDEDEDKEEEDE